MQSNRIEIKAYAKLNLSLDVLGRIDGDYHALRMVMQSASLCDTLTLELRGNGEVTLETNFDFLPSDKRNIAVRAAQEFFRETGMEGAGAHIRIEKRIPVGAGLGGGSADAAAVLRGLNALTGERFSRERLAEWGLRLGSDVPYCVGGGTMLAEGRGEKLSPLPPLPDCGIVICKPPFSLRTPDLFARIDARRSRIHPDTEGLTEALREGDLPGAARRLYNVFEDVLPPRCGEIADIKRALLDAGALGAAMTGTGSAVFGLFADAGAAEAARARLGERYRECFTAAPVGEIRTIME